MILFFFMAQSSVCAQTLQQTAPITQAPSSDTASDAASQLQKTKNADTPSATTSTPAASVPNAYRFTVTEGQNVTQLVRKSILLYDKQRADISLSESQIIYIETYTVEALGSKQVDIGEKVTIETKLLDVYLARVQQLTPAEVATWQPYADGADFTLAGVQPDTTGVVMANDEKSTPTIDVKSDLDPNFKNSVPKTNHSSAFWYWTLSGFGALSIAYYLLSAAPTKETK
jgi:hypothetical protein